MQCIRDLTKKCTVTAVLLCFFAALILTALLIPPPPPPPQFGQGQGQGQGPNLSSGPCDANGNYGGSYVYKKLTAAPLVRHSKLCISSVSSLPFIRALIYIILSFFSPRGER